MTDLEARTFHNLSKYPFAMVTDPNFYPDQPKLASKYRACARRMQKKGWLDEACKPTDEGYWVFSN